MSLCRTVPTPSLVQLVDRHVTTASKSLVFVANTYVNDVCPGLVKVVGARL